MVRLRLQPPPTSLVSAQRSDLVKKETKQWLSIHSVPYKKLFMRVKGDYSPDDELKLS